MFKKSYAYFIDLNSLFLGLAESFGWISWSLSVIKRQPYVWKCITAIVGINVLLLLELGDFPPYWWVFDAHSLWHGGTVPLAVLWGRYVYMMRTFESCIIELNNIHYDLYIYIN